MPEVPQPPYGPPDQPQISGPPGFPPPGQPLQPSQVPPPQVGYQPPVSGPGGSNSRIIITALLVVLLVVGGGILVYRLLPGKDPVIPSVPTVSQTPELTPTPTPKPVPSETPVEVNLLENISITLPPGWKVKEQRPGAVTIIHEPSSTKAFFRAALPKPDFELEKEVKKYMAAAAEPLKNPKTTPIKIYKSKYDYLDAMDSEISGKFLVNGKESELKIHVFLAVNINNGLRMYSGVQHPVAMDNAAVKDFEALRDKFWESSQNFISKQQDNKIVKLAEGIDFELKPGWKEGQKKTSEMLVISNKGTATYAFFETSNFSSKKELKDALAKYIKSIPSLVKNPDIGEIKPYKTKYEQLYVVEVTRVEKLNKNDKKFVSKRHAYLAMNIKTGNTVFSMIQIVFNENESSVKEFEEMRDDTWADLAKQ